MNLLKTRRRAVISLAVVLALLAAGLIWWRNRPDPQLAKVKAMAQKLTGDEGRNLAPDQRRAAFQDLRKEMDKLSPDQRRELGKERRKQFQERIDRFFQLSPQERTAHLDKEIDRMEQFRKQRAAQGPPGGMPMGGFGADVDREERRRRRLDESTAEERARLSEYFRALNERRQQRGLPGWGFGGR